MSGKNQEDNITEKKITSNRFDLEQEILNCWRVTDDIKLFAAQMASSDELKALSVYYEQRFERLWEIFETMVHERKM